MGRKIPGRKHHGVRDPEKQRLERFKKIKDKINEPPKNPDDQQIPKSVLRIAELKNKIKSGEFWRKKSKKPQQHMFQQQPNETDREFLYRINRKVAAIKHEAAFEEKFRVEIKRNAEGAIEEVKKRPKDPIQIMIKEAKMQRKKKKKNSKVKVNEELTKSQKRRRKLLEKKNKKMSDKVDDFSKFKDEVKFGEQVHEPPTLTAPRKVKGEVETPRPGKKDLLLKTMLNKTANKTIDRTGKRKNLPNALRRQLDKQQKEIIEAYRSIKGKNRELIN